MTDIFKMIKKVISKGVEIAGVEEDTTELEDICLSCGKDSSDSVYINFCQLCGDRIERGIDMLDAGDEEYLEEEDFEMIHLHHWGW